MPSCLLLTGLLVFMQISFCMYDGAFPRMEDRHRHFFIGRTDLSACAVHIRDEPRDQAGVPY